MTTPFSSIPTVHIHPVVFLLRRIEHVISCLDNCLNNIHGSRRKCNIFQTFNNNYAIENNRKIEGLGTKTIIEGVS